MDFVNSQFSELLNNPAWPVTLGNDEPDSDRYLRWWDRHYFAGYFDRVSEDRGPPTMSSIADR